MQDKIAVVGMGEMGSVFGRAFLRYGYPVYPIVRRTSQSDIAQELAAPELVLVSVGEADLKSVLTHLPNNWRDRTALLQNELLPRDWMSYHLVNPTIISVWFEKKKGQDVKVLMPSPIFGPHAHLLQTVLGELDIPSTIVEDEAQMVFELVRKNLYILVTNICGLKTGGTVGELWAKHETLVREVVHDVLGIQQELVGNVLDREKLVTAMLVAFNGDPEHKCMGRTAKQRLQRAVSLGDDYRLELPVLRKILREIEPAETHA